MRHPALMSMCDFASPVFECSQKGDLLQKSRARCFAIAGWFLSGVAPAPIAYPHGLRGLRTSASVPVQHHTSLCAGLPLRPFVGWIVLK